MLVILEKVPQNENIFCSVTVSSLAVNPKMMNLVYAKVLSCSTAVSNIIEAGK